MIPPNTVPITAEEFEHLFSNRIELIIWNNLDGTNWISHETSYRENFLKRILGKCEFRIAAHDYRHYFGEVVDLKAHGKQTDKGLIITYLGHKYKLTPDSTIKDHWYLFGKDDYCLQQTEAECKKFLCGYFEHLFKKDLPHLNIRFIWS
jgi:hypothetical protein